MIKYSVDEIDFHDDFETACAFEKLKLKTKMIEVKKFLSLYGFSEIERIYNLLSGKALFHFVYQKKDTDEIIEDYNCSLRKDEDGSWHITGENYYASLNDYDVSAFPGKDYIIYRNNETVIVNILGISGIDIL